MKIEYKDSGNFSSDKSVIVDGIRRGVIIRLGKGKFRIRVDRHEEIYEGDKPRDLVERLLKK